MLWPVAYLLSIVGCNYLFTIDALLVHTSWGVWSWGSLFVGTIPITRDFTDKALGGKRWIYLLVVAGTLATWAMAGPVLATASGTAFLLSEVLDTYVFRRVADRYTFRAGIVASSIVGVPLDTALFLGLLGGLSPIAFAVMTASKLVALGLFCLTTETSRRTPEVA